MAYAKEVIKSVTKRHFKLAKGVEYCFGCISNIYTGKILPGAKIVTPPQMVDVVDFETGATGVVILGTVMHKELTEAFPDGVLGRSLALTTIAPGEGRKYDTCNIEEIKPTPSFAAWVEENKKAKARKVA